MPFARPKVERDLVYVIAKAAAEANNRQSIPAAFSRMLVDPTCGDRKGCAQALQRHELPRIGWEPARTRRAAIEVIRFHSAPLPLRSSEQASSDGLRIRSNQWSARFHSSAIQRTVVQRNQLMRRGF